jgi:cytoskeletal protein CcmA (bactofilin family)|tara:strand:- start:2091 stop:2462 length:372 start_codon:yes stop_codon:yes gene_type:complete
VKKHKNGINDKQVPNIIALGTNIVGDIESEGDFRIEGSVKGKIIAKGRIVVGTSGNVDGEIICSDADIFGSVKGKLEVLNLTVLKATAIFSGDVTTKKISIEPGAVFTGTCQMKSDTSPKDRK